MKYKTKNQRLLAILDAYLVVSKKTVWTMDEVAEWALKNNLWPVPSRNAPIFLAEAWESHFGKFERKP